MRTSAIALSPQTSARNPWPALEQAGLLDVWAEPKAPLEQTVGAETLAGLDALVDRVIEAGGQFERRQGWLDAKLTGRDVAALSAAEAKAFIRRQRLPFRDGLQVSIDGQEHQPVSSMGDLRALDMAYGLRAAIGGTQAPIAQAMQTLLSEGWTFQCSEYGSVFRSTSGPYAALAALAGDATGVYLRRSTSPAQAREVVVSRGQDLVSVAFFEASGAIDGLTDPSAAVALRTLAQRGYTFALEDRPEIAFDAWAVHRALTRGSKDALYVGRPDQPRLWVRRSELDDLSALEKRIEEGERLYAQHGEALIKPLESSVLAHHWVNAVVDPQTCPVLDPPQRASLLASLMDAYAVDSAVSVWSSFHDSVSDMRALGMRLSDPEQVRSEALWLAELRRRCPNSDNDSSGMFNCIRDRFWREAGSPERHAELQGQLLRLAAATRDIIAARELLDVVRIPEGDRGVSNGIAACEVLADAVGGRYREDVAQNLQCVLAHRLPSETLDTSATRFAQALAALEVVKEASRAREVFTVIQESCRGAEEAVIEDRWARFSTDLALTRDVEHALQKVLQSALQDSPQERDGRVILTPGEVVIGPVKLPIRDAPRHSAG